MVIEYFLLIIKQYINLYINSINLTNLLYFLFI